MLNTSSKYVHLLIIIERKVQLKAKVVSATRIGILIKKKNNGTANNELYPFAMIVGCRPTTEGPHS